jgi:hypothetical protein
MGVAAQPFPRPGPVPGIAPKEVPVTFSARAAVPLAAAATLVLLACDAPPPTAADSTAADPERSAAEAKAANGRGLTSPPFVPSSFVSTITNPYLPRIPGTVFHYISRTPDGVETNLVTVTHQTKTILGVTATVVHDQVFLDGELTEDTFDWEAQDGAGNVWYFGEDTKELEDGQVVSTEGSWEAGVNGAHPGIIMLAHPEPGRTYVQEDAPDVAEDRAKSLSTKAKVDVPYGQFDHCLHTLEWTLLEHGDREHKFYCPGIGMVEEVHPAGGHITNELVAITHF